MEIERFEHAGRTVVIHTDEHADSPRETFEHLTTLACWHRRANLGDEQIEPMSAKELMRTLRDRGEKVLALMPLYLYEHSGMTMSASKGNPFTCRWDSGQVGWGYVTQSNAEKMGCVGEYTDHETKEKKAYDKAFFENAIQGEVKEYDSFLTGEVYGYEVLGADDDQLESCWGFYGELDYVRSEAKSQAEHTEDPAVEEAAEEMAERATYAG